MTYSKILTAVILTTSLVLSQTTFAKDEHPRREEVNRRVRNEEKRIAKDLKDGKITAAQAKQLRGELAGVKAEEKAEVKVDGGYLTKTDQKQLNQELNQDGKQIPKDDKHPRIKEVNGRIENQDKRINAGLKDHELTDKQAATLKGEEAGVKAEEKAEVKANGGYLTKGEQKQLNQELNQDSKQIHAEREEGK